MRQKSSICHSSKAGRSTTHLKRKPALAGVAQWIECWPVNQRVTGSIPSQGTYWVASQVPSRDAQETTTH